MQSPKTPTGSGMQFTSASARVAATRCRSLGVFSSSKRSSFSTLGRTTPVIRSLQSSHLLEGSSQYVVESYGIPLPALVLEALKFADRNADMSAVLSPSGWAWIVSGKRVLIWRFRAEDSIHKVCQQFRELTLPSSDLAHRAQLVTVYCSSDGQVPSCIAVSPEGYVRYWPSIAHESSYLELSTELQGQECDSLVFLDSTLGCLLATTTSTILLLQPSASGVGGPGLQVHCVKAPSGLFGGITRRVSSFVFGSLPSQSSETHLMKVLVMENLHQDSQTVLVLSAKSLQKWQLMPHSTDSLIYEANVEKCITDGFQDSVWGRVSTSLHLWLIDMQLIPGTSSVMIFAAAVNTDVSQQLLYALATLEVGGNEAPSSLNSFLVLKHSEYYQESAEHIFLSQKFLFCAHTAYIYSKSCVLCVPIAGNGDIADRYEFSGSGDAILGVGRVQGCPLFFSAASGIVSILISATKSNLLNQSASEDTSQLSGTLNISSAGLDIITASKDNVARLQASFLHFNKNNLTQSQAILDELFPLGSSGLLEPCILQLSLNLLDDSPALDPRWAESGQKGGTGAPLSLVILNQLRDKSTAHQCLISFLQQTGLWQRLRVTTFQDCKVVTRTILQEHRERIAFAIALRNNHSQYKNLIDDAIRFAIAEREEKPVGKLTANDIFYRHVSQVESIVWGLHKCQEEILSADVAPRDAPATIHSVNSLIHALLNAVKEGRTRFGPISEEPCEYVPWTASEGVQGIRTLLLEQHRITVETGLARAEDGPTRAKLFAQLVQLCDDILSGYQPQLLSLSAVSADKHQSLLQQYEKQRYQLIKVLVNEEQYEQAVSLAEKFCDFRTLVEVCHSTDNQERLDQYMSRFSAEGFCDFVFRWYLETGKRGRLLAHVGANTKGALEQFLNDYTSLAWLNQIHCRNYSEAKKTLQQLANDEVSYLSRKKTLLSLSKLCSLAAQEQALEPSLTSEMDLILYQEQLPDTVLCANSLDPDNMRVLSPTELIQLYISADNTNANEFDFKKALELLDYVEIPEEREVLRKSIWIEAAKRDEWHGLDTDNPVDAISETVFFRTVELAFSQGCNLEDLMIPCDELLQSEDLNGIREDSVFQFLIHAGYEKVYSVIS